MPASGEDLMIELQFRIETDLDGLLLPYYIDVSIYNDITNKELLRHIDQDDVSIYTIKKMIEDTP